MPRLEWLHSAYLCWSGSAPSNRLPRTINSGHACTPLTSSRIFSDKTLWLNICFMHQMWRRWWRWKWPLRNRHTWVFPGVSIPHHWETILQRSCTQFGPTVSRPATINLLYHVDQSRQRTPRMTFILLQPHHPQTISVNLYRPTSARYFNLPSSEIVTFVAVAWC